MQAEAEGGEQRPSPRAVWDIGLEGRQPPTSLEDRAGPRTRGTLTMVHA